MAGSLRRVEVACEQVEQCQWVRGDGRLWLGAAALDHLDSCRFRVQLDNFVAGTDPEVDVLIDAPSTPAPGERTSRSCWVPKSQRHPENRFGLVWRTRLVTDWPA